MGLKEGLSIFIGFLITVEVCLITKAMGKEVILSQKLISNDPCSDKENFEVVNGTVCSLSSDNIIDIETRKRIKGKEIAHREGYLKCQQSCFREEICRNFTHFHHTDESNGISTYKCILFRSCSDQIKCATCITGPPTRQRPRNCEKALVKEILTEVIDTDDGEGGELTGEELGKLIMKEMGLYSPTHFIQ